MSKHKIVEHKMKTFFRARLFCFAGQKIVRTGKKRKIAICRTVQPSMLIQPVMIGYIVN